MEIRKDSGNTCKPTAVSFQCMTKSTTKKNNNTDFRENIRCILIKMCACVCVCVCSLMSDSLQPHEL